jgi:hypothetical protein
LVEQGTENPRVGGSTPSLGTTSLFADVRQRLQNARKSASFAIGLSSGIRPCSSKFGRRWGPRWGLLIRLFGQLGDARILVEFVTDELFHVMGVWPEIEPFLVDIAANAEADPETRLWALDRLVFNDLREGTFKPARGRIDERQLWSRRTETARTSGWRRV